MAAAPSAPSGGRLRARAHAGTRARSDLRTLADGPKVRVVGEAQGEGPGPEKLIIIITSPNIHDSRVKPPISSIEFYTTEHGAISTSPRGSHGALHKTQHNTNTESQTQDSCFCPDNANITTGLQQVPPGNSQQPPNQTVSLVACPARQSSTEGIICG